MTPYGLMKTLTGIGDGTGKAIEKNVPKGSKTHKSKAGATHGGKGGDIKK